MTACGVTRLEVERVEVAGEHRDVAVAEIGDHFRRVLQRREAEERRRRDAAERPLHRAETLLDLFLALVFGQLLVGQRRMRPGVGADGMAGRVNLLDDFRIVGGVLADREEDAGGAFVRQRLQHRGRIQRPRAVVEGQHHFLVAQEIELLEMFEAEARVRPWCRSRRYVRRQVRPACCMRLSRAARRPCSGRSGGRGLRRRCRSRGRAFGRRRLRPRRA